MELLWTGFFIGIAFSLSMYLFFTGMFGWLEERREEKQLKLQQEDNNND